MDASVLLPILLLPIFWSYSFNSELSLNSKSTVAAVQEKYMKDDENIDDNE